jgi:hypothetical protein
MDDEPTIPGLSPISGDLPAARPLSNIQQRLIRGSLQIQETGAEKIVYQHTVFCQTVMPYRDPGPTVRLWERVQGAAVLEIQAGRAMDPAVGRFVDVGLPFGPKPRLILYHLNAEALRTHSPEIEIDDTLTAFVKRIGLQSHGRNMRIIKNQLTRLSASDFRLGFIKNGLATTIKASIISGFQLWFPKDENQRVLWPTTVQFSQEYFESLVNHAVPLNESAIALLSHSALSLDIYVWLAQRLHRVPPGRPQLITWGCLYTQFGQNYNRVRKFREVFLEALHQVFTVYSEACLDLTEEGLVLKNSKPPVQKRLVQIRANEQSNR